MTLKEFLIERKTHLLDLEKRATGIALAAMTAQIQMADSILIFLSTQQTEEDMAKLKLTLETQAKPLDELKPRQENEELTEALIELADKLKPNSYLPLNGLPPDLKMKSVTAKVYALRKDGRLPKSIKPITRGKEVFLARGKESKE